MKKKKFRTLLISKYTLIKFFALLCALIFAVVSFKYIFTSPLSGKFLNAFSLSALSHTLPESDSAAVSNQFFFMRRAAVKAAGLQLFDKRFNTEYTPSHDPYPDGTFPYIPVSDSDFSLQSSSAPLPDTSNIEEKTLSGKANTVSIDNKTSAVIDVNTLLNADVPLKSTNNQPLVLIVHTHTTESYTPSEKYNYTPETNARTRDNKFNMNRVGEEFAKGLRENGINVIHDTSINDYPSYNGSYSKTLGVIESYLKKYPSIQIVIDIHRDSMTAADGTKYKLATDINGSKAAQLMIVMGSSEGGLSHPNWQENLKLGLKLQQTLNSDYDNIARPLSVRKERFNTHATKGSMIVEIGTDANTLDEALLCAQYASKSFAKVISSQID